VETYKNDRETQSAPMESPIKPHENGADAQSTHLH